MLHVCHYQFSLYFPTSVNHKNYFEIFQDFSNFLHSHRCKNSNFSFVYSGRFSPIFTCCHSLLICFPYSLWSLCSPTTNTLCSADLPLVQSKISQTFPHQTMENIRPPLLSANSTVRSTKATETKEDDLQWIGILSLS